MSESPDKKTAGSIVADIRQKETEQDRFARRYEQGLKRKFSDLMNGVEDGYKRFDGDFFIEQHSYVDQLMPEITKFRTLSRQTCPIPTYLQDVYRVNREGDELEFLWSLPSKKICLEFLHDPKRVDASWRPMMQGIWSFYDGSLDRYAIETNELIAKEVVHGRKRSSSNRKPANPTN